MRHLNIRIAHFQVLGCIATYLYSGAIIWCKLILEATDENELFKVLKAWE